VSFLHCIAIMFLQGNQSKGGHTDLYHTQIAVTFRNYLHNVVIVLAMRLVTR